VHTTALIPFHPEQSFVMKWERAMDQVEQDHLEDRNSERSCTLVSFPAALLVHVGRTQQHNRAEHHTPQLQL